MERSKANRYCLFFFFNIIICSGHVIYSLSFSFVVNFVVMPWTSSQNRINTSAKSIWYRYEPSCNKIQCQDLVPRVCSSSHFCTLDQNLSLSIYLVFVLGVCTLPELLPNRIKRRCRSILNLNLVEEKKGLINGMLLKFFACSMTFTRFDLKHY